MTITAARIAVNLAAGGRPMWQAGMNIAPLLLNRSQRCGEVQRRIGYKTIIVIRQPMIGL
jgi:hypothetical protein